MQTSRQPPAPSGWPSPGRASHAAARRPPAGRSRRRSRSGRLPPGSASARVSLITVVAPCAWPNWRSTSAALVEVLVVDRVDRDEHVRLAGAQAGLPVLGRARAAVAEALGARRHALAELVREGGEDRRRARPASAGPAYVKATWMARRRRAVLPRLGGRHLGSVGAHQRAGPVDVVDVQEHVGGRGEGVAAQDVALDVGEVDVGGLGAAPGQVARPLERQLDDRLAAARHQRTAFAKVLRKRSCSAAASSPCASTAKSTSARAARGSRAPRAPSPPG